MKASPLLAQYLESLRLSAPVLDLACGRGRNGLYLLRHGVPVTFSDRDPEALQDVRESLLQAQYREHAGSADLWQVDFEQPGQEPLRGRRYGVILVFRYLHRPLFPAIRQAPR